MVHGETGVRMALKGGNSRSKVMQTYLARVDSSEIEPNPDQAEIIMRLEEVALRLAAYQPASAGLFGFLKKKPGPPPRGLYLHGGVGRGKTMLMDLFFGEVDFAPKVRHHFHEFMADVHDRIGRARKAVPGDPIPVVAAEIAETAKLLCFDELHVTDIADAMILGRLFAVLFKQGVVVVSTSNAHPSELYRNGLNRQLFLPFIDLIEDYMDVVELSSGKDFRLEKLAGHPLYFSPANTGAKQELDSHWTRLTGRPVEPLPMSLEVLGRHVHVPMATRGVARFGFDDLCARPLGPRDYLHVAHAFHTVLIDGIPVLGSAKRNEARRFINLIDALYDNKVGLIASADSEPDLLYVAGDGVELFQRTASRLIEMRSQEYLESRTDRTGGLDPLART
jgi:cell division protein ZapE